MIKWKVLAVFFVSLLLMALIAFLYIPDKAKSENYSMVPTVFVHGYKGTFNSFGTMLHRFENEYGWGKKAFVYYVRADGSLHDVRLGKTKGKPNFIQVVFENNRGSFEETTFYLSKVLHHLKQYHHIEAVNLVGHSMGGIVSLKYVMEYLGEAYPNVYKLVFIGSPFAGIFDKNYFINNFNDGAEDLKPGSAAFRLIYKSRFPSGIQVLSVGSIGDAVADPESVTRISRIVPETQLEEIIIENKALGHSALHESDIVDHLIHRFLWQDSVQ